mmetsp:Transcript_28049/g.58436  ORF Transcript_28049/g.58436 Transcript_28049/m.58436 type:complete len:123 (+) Transcript_28049:306-674(+)
MITNKSSMASSFTEGNNYSTKPSSAKQRGNKRKRDPKDERVKISSIREEDDPFLFYSISLATRTHRTDIIPSEVRKTCVSVEKHSLYVLDLLKHNNGLEDDGNLDCSLDFVDDLGLLGKNIE